MKFSKLLLANCQIHKSLIRILSVFFCCSILFLIMSCKTSDISPYKITKPYLFEAKKGSKTIYVFGTIHYGIYSEDLPEWFWPIFNSAEAYAYEDPPDQTSSHFNLWLKKNIRKSSKSESLKQVLTSQEYNNLDYYFPNLKNKEDYFSDKSAFFALQVIQMKQFQKKYGLSNSKNENTPYETNRMRWTNRTLDDDLAKKSKELKKENFRLDEETEDDYNCLYKKDEKEILQDLKYLLSKTQELEILHEKNSFNNDLLKSYISGELRPQKVSAASASALNTNCYITGRNRLWLPRIKNILNLYDKIFIAVGAAHVIKEAPTLLNLLENEGFLISRLTE